MVESTLPPHCPYDHATDVLSNTTPQQSRIYLLLTAENKCMEEYITEALKQGYITPSTLSGSTGFFCAELREWPSGYPFILEA